jgi:hypothetical protein
MGEMCHVTGLLPCIMSELCQQLVGVGLSETAQGLFFATALRLVLSF